MWKCFNRGVWETIDRSVNVFKADTSNGTCLISSLAKDLDGKNEESIKSKPQHCDEYKLGKCYVSEECSSPGENRVQRPVVNGRTLKIHDHARASKVFSRDLPRLRDVTASKIFDQPLAPSIREDVAARPCKGHNPLGILSSCTRHTIDGKCERKCLCIGRPYHDSDYISESHHPNEVRLLYREGSRKANLKWKWQPQELSKSMECVGFLEENGGLHLTSDNIHGSCIPKSNVFSSPGKATLLGDGRYVKEEKTGTTKEKIHSYDLVHSNADSKPNCMLKLPFHCYDLGRFKGLKNISGSCLMKPRGEFGRGDKGGADDEQSGESEEKKEDAWRECHMHQSFLEAIGWSSAVLLGWFLGQFRFWHMHGELRRDNSGNKRKCCIIESLSKLLVTWRGDSALPLRVLPTNGDRISQDFRRKTINQLQGSETTLINEFCCEHHPHPFLVLESEESNLCERSSSNFLLLQEVEDTNYHENYLKPKLNVVNKAEKSIDIPCRVDSAKNLVYGPITLEEAIKEAEKGLEEAQAEVLLALALEKLNEGSSSSKNEPLPADLFLSAASLGSTAAAFNLGICYEKGVGGVVKNLVQAYHWYKQASEQGHAAATYNLAVFHANGLGGLHPNTFLASELLLKASSLGLEEANNALVLISSDLDNRKSSNSPTPVLPSSNLEGVTNKQDSTNIYCESYHESSNDISISMGVNRVSQPYAYFKKTSQMPYLKLGHLLLSQGISLRDSVDAGKPLSEEMLFDDHQCMRNQGVDNQSVQLLAH